MNECKLWKVKLTGIGWDIESESELGGVDYSGIELPENIDEFIVESDANPYVKNHWKGWDLFGEHIVDELAEQYGFCVCYLEDIEILGIDE